LARDVFGAAGGTVKQYIEKELAGRQHYIEVKKVCSSSFLTAAASAEILVEWLGQSFRPQRAVF
jgi:hypothetical protein